MAEGDRTLNQRVGIDSFDTQTFDRFPVASRAKQIRGSGTPDDRRWRRALRTPERSLAFEWTRRLEAGVSQAIYAIDKNGSILYVRQPIGE